MKGKHFIELNDLLLFFYLFPFRILAAILPIKIVRWSGILLVYIYLLLFDRKKRFLQKRLNIAFKNSKRKSDIKKIVNQYIYNAGLKDIDDVILNRLTKKDLLRCSDIKGIENLETALSYNKGVILTSGHFFANRVGKRFLKEIGFPVLSVRKIIPRHDPCISRVRFKYLQPRYKNFVSQVIKDCVFIHDKNCTLKILKRLRENGLVNIHIDARNSYNMIEYPFLGTKRSFPAGFLRIVYQTGVPVVPMVCIGNSYSFTVIFEKMVEIQKISDQETFMSENLATLVKVLESHILRYTDQWELWGVNRQENKK